MFHVANSLLNILKVKLFISFVLKNTHPVCPRPDGSRGQLLHPDSTSRFHTGAARPGTELNCGIKRSLTPAQLSLLVPSATLQHGTKEP